MSLIGARPRLWRPSWPKPPTRSKPRWGCWKRRSCVCTSRYGGRGGGTSIQLPRRRRLPPSRCEHPRRRRRTGSPRSQRRSRTPSWRTARNARAFHQPNCFRRWGCFGTLLVWLPAPKGRVPSTVLFSRTTPLSAYFIVRAGCTYTLRSGSQGSCASVS